MVFTSVAALTRSKRWNKGSGIADQVKKLPAKGKVPDAHTVPMSTLAERRAAESTIAGICHGGRGQKSLVRVVTVAHPSANVVS